MEYDDSTASLFEHHIDSDRGRFQTAYCEYWDLVKTLSTKTDGHTIMNCRT